MSMVELSFELCAWKPFYRALRIVQGESDSRSFVIQLRDNQNPVNLAGSQAKLFVRKPDKKVVWQDCSIVDAAKGIIQVTLKSQVAAVSGTATCWIQVYRTTGEDLRFGGIRLEVEDGDIAGAIESTNEFAELLLAIQNANDTAQRLMNAKESGEFNGCYFTPKVEQLSDTDVKFSFVPSEAGVLAPSPVIVKLAAGTGGSSVAWKQPDFNQNDPDELDHIRNRTHWEENRSFDIEWNGKTVGLRTYTDGFGTVYYQISTVCPEADDIMGAVIELSNGTKLTVSKKLFSGFGSNGQARIGSYLYAVLRPLPVTAPNLPDPKTVGLYASLANVTYPTSETVYPARFSNSRTVVHQLDEKFIPDSIARKSDLEGLGGSGSSDTCTAPDIFNLYVCGEDEYSADGNPNIAKPAEDTTYLVPKDDNGTVYDSFVYANGRWEFVETLTVTFEEEETVKVPEKTAAATTFYGFYPYGKYTMSLYADKAARDAALASGDHNTERMAPWADVENAFLSGVVRLDIKSGKESYDLSTLAGKGTMLSYYPYKDFNNMRMSLTIQNYTNHYMDTIYPAVYED